MPGVRDLRGESIEVDPPLPVDGDGHHLEPVGLERVGDASDGGVFDGAEHDPRPELADGAHATPDRERDRFGARRR